jgi:hypothetical protein
LTVGSAATTTLASNPIDNAPSFQALATTPMAAIWQMTDPWSRT